MGLGIDFVKYTFERVYMQKEDGGGEDLLDIASLLLSLGIVS